MSHRSLSKAEMEQAGMKANRGIVNNIKKLTMLKVLANEVRDAYDENITIKEKHSVRHVVAGKMLKEYRLGTCQDHFPAQKV